MALRASREGPEKSARVRMKLYDRLPPAIRHKLANAPRDIHPKFLIEAVADYDADVSELSALVEDRLERALNANS